MIDVTLAKVQSVTTTWRQEASKRRQISRTDPIADTLEFCACELTARLRSIEYESRDETVEERARREGVTPQTVRTWIRTNQLPAKDGAKGYRIPISAQRVRRVG